MKRDWDVIRDVLLEVEALSKGERQSFQYRVYGDVDDAKQDHAFMLYDAGFLTGAHSNYLDGGSELLSPELTWEGRDLLASVESKPVWDRVKSRAAEEGVVMTFEVVKGLARQAVSQIFQFGG